MSISGELSQCKQCKDNGLVGSLRRGFGGVLMITARRGAARAMLWLRVRHSALSPILSLRTTQPTARQHYSNHAIHSRLCVSPVLPNFNCNAISVFHKSRVGMTVQLKRSFTEQMNVWLYISFSCSRSRLPASTISEQPPVLGSYVHISQEILLWLQRWTTLFVKAPESVFFLAMLQGSPLLNLVKLRV